MPSVDLCVSLYSLIFVIFFSGSSIAMEERSPLSIDDVVTRGKKITTNATVRIVRYQYADACIGIMPDDGVVYVSGGVSTLAGLPQLLYEFGYVDFVRHLILEGVAEIDKSYLLGVNPQTIALLDVDQIALELFDEMTNLKQVSLSKKLKHVHELVSQKLKHVAPQAQLICDAE